MAPVVPRENKESPFDGAIFVPASHIGRRDKSTLKRLTKIAETKGLSLFSSGTPFQQKVWRELMKIPHGEVRSYGWVAKNIGCPGGARAVGQAVKKNPYPIVIPCHRVIASDGSIGGFAHGVKMKRKLLAREGVFLK